MLETKSLNSPIDPKLHILSYADSRRGISRKFKEIDVSLGHTSAPLCESAITTIRELKECDFRYYESDFESETLILSLSKYFKNPSIHSKNTFFGYGANHLLERIFCFLFRDAKMQGVGPFFTHAAKHCLLNGGTFKSIHRNLTSGVFPISQLLESISNSYDRPSVVYIDNPNNPLGKSIDLESLTLISAACCKYGIPLIVDEAFGDYLPSEQSAVQIVNKFSNIIVLRSFSKLYGLAGCRIGYAVVSRDLEIPFAKFSQPFEPSTISFKLANAALSDVHHRSELIASTTSYKRKLIKQISGTSLISLPSDDSTSIITLYRPESDLYSNLLNHSIRTTPGISFGVTHKLLSNAYVRIRIPATEGEWIAFSQALNIFLGSYG